MPGLIRGIARTAVIAGTATAVSNGVSRRQAGRWARQENAQQQPEYQEPQPVYAAPPPPPPEPARPQLTMEDKLAQLTQLGQLKEAGVLTDAEFEAQKRAILGT